MSCAAAPIGTDKIDPEQLIALVRARPGLWDKSLEHHKEFDQRAAAWRDICRVLFPDYEALSRKDKHLYVKTVVKKWTNIRDAWKKSLAEHKRRRQLRPYHYHEHLKFLEKNLDKQNIVYERRSNTARPRKSRGNADDNADTLLLEDSDASECMMPDERENSLRGGKKYQLDDMQESETSIQFMDMNSLDGKGENPHICFIRSLLPSLNQLDDDETLEFQVRVIRQLQEVRRKSKPVEVSISHSGVASSSGELNWNIKEEF